MTVLGDHKDKFGASFDDNKKILNDISIIRSKSLKNKIAGYITKLIKNEIRINAEKEKQQSDVTEPESKDTIVVERPQIHGGKGSTKDVVDTSEIVKTESTESPKKDTDTNE